MIAFFVGGKWPCAWGLVAEDVRSSKAPFARRAARRVYGWATDALGRTGFGTVTSVATARPWVALTFDDGPHPRWTPQVLDVLDAHGAKATFFVLGRHVARHPDVMARLVQGGHALGNHSHGHPRFPAISSAERRRELRDCAAALAPYPQAKRLFRPPHLDQSLASRFDAWRHGYDVVACNRHAQDWQERSAEAMARELADLRGGDIVMLHDTMVDLPHRGRAEMLRALDLVLKQHAHLRFVPVPALLAVGRARRRIWLKGRRIEAPEVPVVAPDLTPVTRTHHG